MKRIVLGAFGAAALASAAFAAAPSIPPAQRAAICGKRATCAVTALHDAGKDGSGAALVVAEVHFGLKDKPDDAPDDGCTADPDSEKKDGGVEYWLLGAKPVQVLKLCNDGYGAADVGEDDVKFSSNLLIHRQDGGSNWRWTNTDTMSLSPLATLTSESCSYFDGDARQGAVTFADNRKFYAITIAKDPGYHWGDNDDMGCPDTKLGMFAVPQPRYDAKTVGAVDVVTPDQGDATFAGLTAATAPGTCSTTLSTDGRAGFIVFGKPATAANVAEMRVIAPTSHSLLFEVYDPVAAPAPAGKTWISGSHIEVWVNKNPDSGGAIARSDLDQFSVNLDGTVNKTNASEMPTVTHRQGTDEKGRPVSVLLLNWAAGDYPISAGTVVVYSQAEGGKQARLVANAGMLRGLPIYLPGIPGMQRACTVRAGRLDLK